MTRHWLNTFLAVLLVTLAGRQPSPAADAAAPDFKEVYELIRTNATGLSDAELNRAAVQGLVTALAPKVSLATGSTSAGAQAETPLVSLTSQFEGDILYLRITRVGNGLAQAVSAACPAPGSTNKLNGLVLDLRFADGADYAAAVAVADLFAAKAEPLLNWGAGLVSSHEKNNAFQAPVAVLVNRQTARAAEALAASLRQTGAGLLLGSRTAGQAMVMREFPLKSGGQLLIAGAPVTLGDGTALSAEGLKPDIEVNVSADDERAYFANAFVFLDKTLSPAGAALSAANRPGQTNRAARPRVSEAELVRAHKAGTNSNLDPELQPGRLSPAPPAEPEKPVVNDPALARALDLLRGLAVVRQGRS